MTVRRFLCSGSGCPRRIFAEPLDGFAAKHARTTTRLAQTHLAIGSALGGEAGARLAEKTAVPTSPDTLLRRVKQAGARSSGTPRFVGIDDWAWCKGQRYGTIVVDLETNDVIDLLPDRDAATVRTWLEAHPGIELVSRDRSSAYSQAASEAAPEAQQVADRWHLLKNVREAIERLLERHLPVITEALKPADPDPATDGRRIVLRRARVRDDPPSQFPRNRRRLRLRPHLDRKPRSRSDSGASSGSSGSMNSVGKGRRSDRSPESSTCRGSRCVATSVASDVPTGGPDGPHGRGWTRTASGSTPASPKDGSTHPSCMRELASRGVRLSYATVRRYLTKRLGRAGKTRPRVNAAKPKPAPPPSPKQLSFDWVRRPEKRTVEAQARLDKIRAASPDLTAALDLADEFTALIRKRSTGTLKEWLSRAEVSPCPEVRHFAEGIRRDESAVNAAVTTRWSNGPVEGHVNRLKIVAADCPDCHSPSLGFERGCEDSPLHSSTPLNPGLCAVREES